MRNSTRSVPRKYPKSQILVQLLGNSSRNLPNTEDHVYRFMEPRTNTEQRQQLLYRDWEVQS